MPTPAKHIHSNKQLYADRMIILSLIITPEIPATFYIFIAIVFAGAIILIFLVLLLVFVKRPSPSGEASGAMILTIAAIILLSGVWSIWFSPTIDIRKYDEITMRSINIEPFGSTTQTFEAKSGQEIEVNIDSIRIIYEPGREDIAFAIFTVRIYDPEGRLVWAQNNATQTFFTQPYTVSGTYRIEVGNLKEELIGLNIRVTDRTKTTIRPLEPAGQWLILISLPVFGLGAWFALSKKTNQS